MHGSTSVAIAAVFVWLGMVLAISFIEAPLKFRAPGVTLQLGLGIGRLVFRALNACEAALALVVVIALAVRPGSVAAMTAFAVVVAALLLQLAAVRPALTRRSDEVLEGVDGPRSQAHYWYVALEIIKVVALVTTGVALLAG